MLTPNHRMGVHWIPIHQRREDEDYMRALKPSAIKIINPDPEQVKRCLEYIDPNGVVVLRDHPLSEQKEDMKRDPVGTGRRHAEEWDAKLKDRFAWIDRSRLVICGINEPFVRDEGEERITIGYTAALLARAADLNLRVLALNLSVGWPRNTGTGAPPLWDNFKGLEPLLLKTNSFLGVHEYWYDQPENGYGWLAGRINKCPLNVPIIIGECGIEKLVDDQRWHNEGMPSRGWRGTMSGADYADQLWRYADGLNPNVFSVMPFTTDWGSHDWDSLDTFDAQSAIVSKAHATKWPNPYPTNSAPTYPTKPPTLPPPPSTGYRLLWPVMPVITQYFSGNHTGIDIAVALNTPIRAMWDGIIAWADKDDPTVFNGGYGNYVRVYHPDLGLDSFYGHLTKSVVTNNQIVKRGDLLGYSGSTGNSTGPHIHFEIRIKMDKSFNDRQGVSAYNRAQVDPLGVLWAYHNLWGHDEYNT